MIKCMRGFGAMPDPFLLPDQEEGASCYASTVRCGSGAADAQTTALRGGKPLCFEEESDA